MKDHKFQLIRIGVPSKGASVRFHGESEKQYQRIRGIFVALPDPRLDFGSTLGFKVDGAEVFQEEHDVRLLSCGQGVAPNEKFFLFEEHLDADGSALELRYKDSGLISDALYPYEAKVYLWLVNDKD
jgi:hypothetical protein